MSNTCITEARLMDCMEYMAGFQDGYFDLAVVDPPYGIGEDGGKSQSRRISSEKWKSPGKSNYKVGGWDKEPPNEKYFFELQRVSKNLIIWGANHFISHVAINSPAWIVWDKKDGKDASDFSDCELALTTFKVGVRMFKMHWTGWGAINARESRIHPTQKPIALYKWIFQNYAKPDWRILDTHLGSGSSRIAAYDMGLDFYSCELDPDYFAAQEKRFSDHISKPQLFAPEQQYNFKQAEIFTPETLEK